MEREELKNDIGFQNWLRNKYIYDPEEGKLFIRLNDGTIKETGLTKHKSGKNYICKLVTIIYNKNKYSFLAHHLAYFLYYNTWACEIDHKDQNALNNKISNLRESTASQNSQNKSKQSNNTSGYKGVNLCKKSNKWRARIKKDGILIHIAWYDCIKDAATAYNLKAYELFGEFACFNE